MVGPISGKGIHGRIGSNLIAGIYDIQVREDGDNLDATTADDLGGLRDDTGCSRLTMTLKGYFSLLNGSVSQVRRGTTVVALNAYLTADESTGKRCYIGEGKVQSCELGGTVRDRVMFTAVIVSQGNDYSMP